MNAYMRNGKVLVLGGKLAVDPRCGGRCRCIAGSFTFAACIDRNLTIEIRKNQIRLTVWGSGYPLWKPGEHSDCPQTPCGTQVMVDGVPRTPAWIGDTSDGITLSGGGVFCPDAVLSVQVLQGRGSVTAGGGTVVISDDPYGGSACYSIVVSWTCSPCACDAPATASVTVNPSCVGDPNFPCASATGAYTFFQKHLYANGSQCVWEFHGPVVGVLSWVLYVLYDPVNQWSIGLSARGTWQGESSEYSAFAVANPCQGGVLSGTYTVFGANPEDGDCWDANCTATVTL